MKLLVGLGNPGSRYENNRHNVGFMAVDAIAREAKAAGYRKRFNAELAAIEIAGEACQLLKPLTFMNESGQSVGEAMRFFKLSPADVIVLHDELDLAAGKLKVKTGGGNAGHNGLRSITAHIGNDYVRVRIGIGHPGVKELVHHHVLSDFAKSDQIWLKPLLEQIASAAEWLAKGDYARFQSAIARALAEEPETKHSGREKPAKASDAKKRGDVAEGPQRPAEPQSPPNPFMEKLRSLLKPVEK